MFPPRVARGYAERRRSLSMGLIEKRLIKEAKETWLPGEAKDMQEAAGAPVEIDIDWASFESSADALKNLPHLGMRKMANAFRVICVDELGKEAVRESVKRVVITNVQGEAKISLENGVITLACAFAKGSDGCLGDLLIARTIEKML